MEQILRVQINLLCFLVLAALAPALERRSSKGAPDALAFKLLAGSTAALLFLDALAWALNGSPGGAARIILYAANSLYFAIHPLPSLAYLVYADYQVRRDPSRSARLAKPLAALYALLAAWALSTPLDGWIFRIDEANRYRRGPGFAVYGLVLFALLGLSAISLISGRRRLRPGAFWSLLAYPLPVAAAALAQDLAYGLVLVWPATTIFIVVAAVNLQRRRASTDHLTGAANRRSLDEELERLAGSGKPARPFGGILLDLDDFKSINDRCGHEAGDSALEDAAAILRSSVRQGDLVARYGGDEFVVILPEAAEASLDEVVRRIRAKAEALGAREERPYRLSFSVGSALYDPEADGSAARFLARLDAAMYADKEGRKARGRPDRASSEPG
ncbi:MAG TPA: GGDEF domain-containing protein [Spirochaetales bacterium]|nr:GGDEF domain-containing protein [Spirochaetales bacterium]